MSIFPKKITKGENVVIHVRLINFSVLPLPVFLNIYIENPKNNYKKVLLNNHPFIIPPKKREKDKESIIDKYFLFSTSNKNPLGKYKCFTNIILFGRKEKSLTIKDDYFLIEKVEIYKKDNFILFKNLSNIPVEIEIYYIDKVIYKKIKGSGTIRTIKNNFIYARYANGELLL